MPVNHSEGDTYGQILKSTTIIGGSQVFSVLLGIVRTKFLAVLLGPGGVGLVGIYGAITGLVGTFTGMGVGSSGVRQIAEAAGTGDSRKIAETIFTLRKVSLIAGVSGMGVLAAFSQPICRLTFGHTRYASAVSLLSVTILLGALTNGQAALIRGLRNIRGLAKLTIWGALFSTVFSIPLVYLWGEDGIVPFLIAVSAMGILPSWWYARKISIARVRMTWQDVRKEVGTLLGLGFVFMATALMTAATMYFLRVIVVRELGIESAGYYQAAMSLSSFYVGIILHAMGADFYPRLTAVANDNETCNRLVNEQAEVGLLISVPGIMATIVLAPLVIHIFYSAKFFPAVAVLRWQLLGLFLRIICWPVGYVLLAKGRGRIFFCTEFIFNAIHMGLIWAGIRLYGLPGTGMAFCILYVLYSIMIFIVVHKVSNFSWSDRNKRLCLVLFPSVAVVFLLPLALEGILLLLLGIGVTIGVSIYSAKTMYQILGPLRVLRAWSRMKTSLGFFGK